MRTTRENIKRALRRKSLPLSAGKISSGQHEKQARLHRPKRAASVFTETIELVETFLAESGSLALYAKFGSGLHHVNY